METRPFYWMGLLQQMAWGLVSISYLGDPLNVGGSRNVNIFGTRRRVIGSLWFFLNDYMDNSMNKMNKGTTGWLVEAKIRKYLLGYGVKIVFNKTTWSARYGSQGT